MELGAEKKLKKGMVLSRHKCSYDSTLPLRDPRRSHPIRSSDKRRNGHDEMCGCHRRR